MTRRFAIALAALMMAILACTPIPASILPTATPTKPPAIPTLAPMPTPAASVTRAPTPKPAATPTPSGVLFNDDFSSQQVSEDNGWSFKAGDNVDRNWSANKLIISIKKKQYLGLNWPDGARDDFGAEVEAQPNSASAEYGIAFRISDDKNSYYVFGITTDGKYYLDKLINDEWADPSPVNKTASQYVKQGKAKNTLAVLAEGSKISLYINGFGVKTITDKSLSEGTVGVFAGSGNSNSAEVAFSRMTILSVDKAKADFGPLPGGAPGAQPTPGQPATGGGSGNGVFYVRNTFSGACQVTVWGKSNASIRAEANSTASKSLPPGTYGAKVALANGREADVPIQLQLPAGGYCTITCYEKSIGYGCGQ
jgi:hypothetical protein